MGFFDKMRDAQDNYEKRQKANEWNYRAKEYVQTANSRYEDAYYDLVLEVDKVRGKIYEYGQFKKQILQQINDELHRVDAAHKELRLTAEVRLPDWQSSGVHVEEWEKLNGFDKLIETWTAPSISDFFHDATEDYYEAKMNLNRAKSYKESMSLKRDQLREAKYAVREIPGFIDGEKRQIEQLMEKFRTILGMVKSAGDQEKVTALRKIAEVIANSMTTDFLNSNYQVTSQYQTIHNQMVGLNDSIGQLAWLTGK